MTLAMYRVIAGPTMLDRIIGVNVVGSQTTILLLLIGCLYDDLSMFADIAIAYAMLNFILSLGITRFVIQQRRKAIPKENA